MAEKYVIISIEVEILFDLYGIDNQYKEEWKKLVKESAIKNIEHRQVKYNCQDYDTKIYYDWIIACSYDGQDAMVKLRDKDESRNIFKDKQGCMI